MKAIFALGTAGVAAAMTLESSFEDWKTKHSKVYKSDKHEQERLAIFKQNAATVEAHNMDATQTYKMGLNHFADWTNEEYKNMLFSSGRSPQSKGATYMAPSNVQIPDEVDWRKEGYVTDVKQQGDCGSCWAFATVATIEGQYFKKTGKLQQFSEQQLVDCGSASGNGGCDGGLIDLAYDYVETLSHGLDTEESYPYTGEEGSCKPKSGKTVSPSATVTGYVDIMPGNETDLTNAIATVGPIGVAIDASQIGFQLYHSGVYHSYFCRSGRNHLDHAVTAVGYGTENGHDYYLIKNSWGTGYGENGYVKMSRNKRNNCGVATCASYPLV